MGVYMKAIDARKTTDYANKETYELVDIYKLIDEAILKISLLGGSQFTVCSGKLASLSDNLDERVMNNTILKNRINIMNRYVDSGFDIRRSKMSISW